MSFLNMTIATRLLFIKTSIAITSSSMTNGISQGTLHLKTKKSLRIHANIKNRLIDWNLLFAVPLQKGAAFPKLIEHIPGAAPPDLPPELKYLDFSQDKAYMVATLAEKERKLTANGMTPITDLVKGSTERTFFEMSHNYPSVHTEFAQRYCRRRKENVEAAREELARFFAENSEFSREDERMLRGSREL